MPTDPNPSDIKPVAGAITVKDTPHAPVVYFDGAPNFGNRHGVVNVTLAINRHLANVAGGVDVDVVAVVDLRCSVAAAVDLRTALDKAILLGAPTAGGDKAN
jgi:hypothetical protein